MIERWLCNNCISLENGFRRQGNKSLPLYTYMGVKQDGYVTLQAIHILSTKLTNVHQYHLECIQLEQVPKNWVCKACLLSQRKNSVAMMSLLPYIDQCLITQQVDQPLASEKKINPRCRLLIPTPLWLWADNLLLYFHIYGTCIWSSSLKLGQRLHIIELFFTVLHLYYFQKHHRCVVVQQCLIIADNSWLCSHVIAWHLTRILILNLWVHQQSKNI